MLIALTRSLSFLVDDDFVIPDGATFRPSAGRGGYVYVVMTVGGRQALLHRHITGVESSAVVDHFNHDTLDNRRVNLRVCTRSENQMHRGPFAGRRFKCIEWRRGRWAVRVGANGRRYRGGSFVSEVEAAAAANLLIAKLHGPFAKLNVIP